MRIEERRAVCVREPPQAVPDHVLLADRDGVLVLQEAGTAVDPVPLPDAVERVEEARDGVDRAVLFRGCLAEPHLVERRHAGPA